MSQPQRHRNIPSPLSPDAWMADLFRSKAVMDGAVIRRKIRDIERYAGMQRFEKELRRRGFQAFANGGQLIIVCNQDPVRRVL
ncbi:N-(5'-phosphoribosyl)anthranilate isomerase [Seohaeicola saemankumensis]|nr:N-(5'-phosphoribosyl)anthranilate isomerase [Seohaeicola saemankumensis]MCA0872155.1 N-(5'-phosphoribosyl)anthranilate isomerase [Seohaeicola saemankumensis]